MKPGFIKPEWPAPGNVHSVSTLRTGGVSEGPYASFNLAEHTGDDPLKVKTNRKLLMEKAALPAEPVWLQQVHGNRVIDLADRDDRRADAIVSDLSGQVCAVMTADCLPVLFCNRDGTLVAAAHAGWRGLLAGVITQAYKKLGSSPEQTLVWLGPGIGADAFEVGADVLHAFEKKSPVFASAFRRKDAMHWLCDAVELARIELRESGIEAVYGGQYCTFTDSDRFFSYRRDGMTGRMATLIWLD